MLRTPGFRVQGLGFRVQGLGLYQKADTFQVCQGHHGEHLDDGATAIMLRQPSYQGSLGFRI